MAFDCSKSSNSQEPDKVECTDSGGSPMGVSQVKITFFGKDGDQLQSIPSDGIVSIGEYIAVLALGVSPFRMRNRQLISNSKWWNRRHLKKKSGGSGGGSGGSRGKFDSETFVTISSMTGSVLQTHLIHTSCSQGFNKGDIYGALELLGGDGSGACYKRNF